MSQSRPRLFHWANESPVRDLCARLRCFFVPRGRSESLDERLFLATAPLEELAEDTAYLMLDLGREAESSAAGLLAVASRLPEGSSEYRAAIGEATRMIWGGRAA